jgi:hypothetical protein
MRDFVLRLRPCSARLRPVSLTDLSSGPSNGSCSTGTADIVVADNAKRTKPRDFMSNNWKNESSSDFYFRELERWSILVCILYVYQPVYKQQNRSYI